MTVAEQILRAKDDYDAVYDAGKQAEYGAFWDVYQENGNRTSYANAFSGTGWTDATFRPKYPLRIKNAGNMFTISKITDYVAVANRIGGMDFTDCTSYSYCWQNASITRIGDLDFSKCTSSSALQSTFYLCKSLKSIGTIKVSESNTFPRTFENCTALEDVTFEGKIAKSISFKESTLLSAQSVYSIASALKNFAGTADANTQTITLPNDAIYRANVEYGSWFEEWLYTLGWDVTIA